MHWNGIIVGIGALLIIGILHPVAIKAEYYFSKRIWPLFLIGGLACNLMCLWVPHTVASALLAVLGCSLLWCIRELLEQEKRVAKGWYPARHGLAPMPRKHL